MSGRVSRRLSWPPRVRPSTVIRGLARIIPPILSAGLDYLNQGIMPRGYRCWAFGSCPRSEILPLVVSGGERRPPMIGERVFLEPGLEGTPVASILLARHRA